MPKGPRLLIRAGAWLLSLLLLTSCFGGNGSEDFSGVHIEGNRLVDASGEPLQLRGVSEQGPEYACVEPIYTPERESFFDGPVDDKAISAMVSWNINAVRVPLNEQCWLGVNPVERGRSPDFRIRIRDDVGAGEELARAYQSAITGYVRRLQRHGIVAILDLHWSAPGNTLAFNQWPMPNVDHSVDFWRSVARTFRNDSKVIFELFHEPFTRDPSLLPWACLRDGCVLPNACADCDDGLLPTGSVSPGCEVCPTPAEPQGSYPAAGMQSLVDAVRSTGARQPVLVPGRYYSNDLERWLEYRPNDPLEQVGASFHAYEGFPCDGECWDRAVAEVAEEVPVVATEFGPYIYNRQEPCREDSAYDRRFMQWADDHGVSYVAWSWYRDTNTRSPNCSFGLVTAYDGTPRAGHGRAVRDHLRQDRARHVNMTMP